MMAWSREYYCETCGRPHNGTFWHYQRYPGCDPNRKPPKFQPAHGGYPG